MHEIPNQHRQFFLGFWILVPGHGYHLRVLHVARHTSTEEVPEKHNIIARSTELVW